MKATATASGGKVGCTHLAASLVFEANKCQVWAGSQIELSRPVGLGLIVSAVPATSMATGPVRTNKKAKDLLPKGLYEMPTPAVLELDWPDFGAPPVGKAWWELLADTLLAYDGAVGFCCTGGHGRTGTALSILCVLMGVVEGTRCPVKWVRNNYCGRAVESQAQFSYIEAVTGRKVRTKLKTTGGSGFYGHWGWGSDYETGADTVGAANTASPVKDLETAQSTRERMWEKLTPQVTAYTKKVEALVKASLETRTGTL